MSIVDIGLTLALLLALVGWALETRRAEWWKARAIEEQGLWMARIQQQARLMEKTFEALRHGR